MRALALVVVSVACVGLATDAQAQNTSNLLFGEVRMLAVPSERVNESPQTLDDLFAAVARRVPEFGGMFYGPDEQTLQVYLTATSGEKVAAVQRAVVAVFGAGSIPSGGIKALKGQYGFLLLKEQYDRMLGPIFHISGVTLTDIDEAKNRLRIGIEKSDIEAQVVDQLNKLSIPREAVVIDVTGPIVLSALTVDSAHNPRQGGYQITRLLCNQTGVGISDCTLGFNARFGLGMPGFVTNSHCTRFSWGLDTALGCPPSDTFGGGCPGSVSASVGCPVNSCPPCDFYQAPGFFPTEFVGTEFLDPPGFTGGPCPTGNTCRWSEGALVRYNTGVPWEKGIIAKTNGITTSISSPVLTVSAAPPPPLGFGPGRFGIVAPPSLPYLVGLPLAKVGRTTGWTQGSIQSTCVDVCFSDDNVPNRILLCQYMVGHPTNDVVDGGDSGSAVFRISNSALNRVELYGSLWGGPAASHKSFLFSPIGGVTFQAAGIQSDLGSLDYLVSSPCVLSPGMTAAHNTFARRITLAQTFTPIQNGSLSKITHGLQNISGVANYDLLVTTTTAGLPSWTGGTYNAPSVLFKATGLTVFSNSGIVNGVVTIPSGQEPYLIAGTEYALILIAGSPTTGDMKWRGNSSAGSYPNGSAYELHGTTWTVPTTGPKDHGFKLDGLCP
jgi:hypothetical protein